MHLDNLSYTYVSAVLLFAISNHSYLELQVTTGQLSFKDPNQIYYWIRRSSSLCLSHFKKWWDPFGCLITDKAANCEIPQTCPILADHIAIGGPIVQGPRNVH